MRIVVVTRGVPARQHTHRLLAAAGVPHTLVVHDDETALRLRAALDTPVVDIRVSGTTTLVEKRNWILNKLVEPSQWFVGMDDNIRGFTAVDATMLPHHLELPTAGPPPAGATNWRRVFNQPLEANQWLKHLERDVDMAREVGAPLVGVATMENHYFRARRYGYRRFVKTKVFAMRNDRELRFKYEQCHDSYLSALAVAHYGKVLVDQWLHHTSTMYEAGGLGNRQEREAKGLLEQMAEVCAQFPGLVVVGRGANTALRFRLSTASGVDRWRVEHGYA